MGEKRWCIQGNWTGRVWDKSRRSLALPPQKNIFFKISLLYLGRGGAFCYFCSMLGAFLGRASKEGGALNILATLLSTEGVMVILLVDYATQVGVLV